MEPYAYDLHCLLQTRFAHWHERNSRCVEVFWHFSDLIPYIVGFGIQNVNMEYGDSGAGFPVEYWWNIS